MEACGSTHYWSRVITRCGHEVKAIAPKFITPYRKGNKNDYNYAEAIAEASRYLNVAPHKRAVNKKQNAIEQPN
jgi:transposase